MTVNVKPTIPQTQRAESNHASETDAITTKHAQKHSRRRRTGQTKPAYTNQAADTVTRNTCTHMPN